MAVSDDIVLFGISLFIYLILAIKWEFSLFNKKVTDTETNALKVLLIWILVWLQPLLIQILLEFAGDLSRSADIITLYETYYQISIWISWFITIYLLIYFSYNILLYIANITGKKNEN